MGRGWRIWILLLVFGLLGATQALAEGPKIATGTTPGRNSVSYIANVVRSKRRCGPGGCQWRLYRPATNEDIHFLTLPTIPWNVFWDNRFEHAYYRLGSSFYRVDWRSGAPPEVLFRLPSEIGTTEWAILDIWKDPSTDSWKLRSSEDLPKEFTTRYRVWEYSPKNTEWTVLAEKKISPCEGGWCPDPLEEFIRKETIHEMSVLRWQMKLVHHLSKEQLATGLEDNKPVYIRSRNIDQRGITVHIAVVETNHVYPPVMYLNHKTGEETVVYEKRKGCTGDLLFMEQGHYLLIAQDYRGDCGRVIDMKSGEIVYDLPPNAWWAVWVPGLQNNSR